MLHTLRGSGKDRETGKRVYYVERIPEVKELIDKYYKELETEDEGTIYDESM